MRLRGTRAVVTGASAGIGRATALELARRGCTPVLVARDRARLQALADSTGGEVTPCDLADDTAVGELVDQVLSAGVPDIVVNNAGIGLFGAAADLTDEALRRLLAVNVTAPLLLTSALLPQMLQRGSGHLVFVSSIAARLGVAHEAAYAASKAALDVYAAGLAAELPRQGVRVTTVVPGVVDTEFFVRRGAAYARRFPPPISAERVARRLADAVEHDRSDVVIPGWLRVPIAVRGLAPGLYTALAARFT
ncbi:MAG TPA: SDR family NAD(P)-dependent oxidoreductase [Nocardioidaceae bacterium]|nr:SDR family NAD(P)-dependent oxidoreductase [Nocardioidaceae bacterium]